MWWSDKWGSYYDFCARELKVKPRPTVLHQKTCPVCNRKLVNVYYSSQTDTYICKHCMDKLLESGAGK